MSAHTQCEGFEQAKVEEEEEERHAQRNLSAVVAGTQQRVPLELSRVRID